MQYTAVGHTNDEPSCAVTQHVEAATPNEAMEIAERDNPDSRILLVYEGHLDAVMLTL